MKIVKCGRSLLHLRRNFPGVCGLNEVFVESVLYLRGLVIPLGSLRQVCIVCGNVRSCSNPFAVFLSCRSRHNSFVLL